MTNFVYYLIGFFVFAIAFSVVMLIKNEITYKNQEIILFAIHEYNEDMISRLKCSSCISYDEMEDYNSTLWRLWDWGYKHIVPPEIFEAIIPYINKM